MKPRQMAIELSKREKGVTYKELYKYLGGKVKDKWCINLLCDLKNKNVIYVSHYKKGALYRPISVYKINKELAKKQAIANVLDSIAGLVRM